MVVLSRISSLVTGALLFSTESYSKVLDNGIPVMSWRPYMPGQSSKNAYMGLNPNTDHIIGTGEELKNAFDELIQQAWCSLG